MLLHLQDHTDTGSVQDVPGEERLSRAIWLHAGLPAPHLCDGLGRCGRCRVRLEPEAGEPLPPPLDMERQVLGADTNAGWRLACRNTVAGVQGFTVHVPGTGAQSGPEPGDIPPSPGVTGALRLAVDLGTTTVHWRFLNQHVRAFLPGQSLNPQCGAGSDVMSRLQAAASPEGRERLGGMVHDLLRSVIRNAEDRMPGASVEEVCLAANTAMTAIFLNLDVTPLSTAPYRLPLRGGHAVELPDLPPVWIPPQPAPFIGGDVAAGMARALSEQTPFPFLFADMGTNGECVLALDADHALLASVPLGPALEGIGLACGGVAGPGSVTEFTLGPGGLAASVPGGETPRSICGTGALSLLDVLLRAGVLTPDGLLAEPDYPLARTIRASIRQQPHGWHLPLPGGLFFSADDVESVLKVRAAFSVALRCLLEQASLPPQALSTLLLAGSLGQHTPADLLVRLGFIPPELGGKARIVGNASLDGASLLAGSPEWRARIIAWAEGCTVVDVSARPDFMQLFAASMRFARGEPIDAVVIRNRSQSFANG